MGFFEVLEVGVKKGTGIAAEFANHTANRIDRMSDKEIESEFKKSADEMRVKADQMHVLYDRHEIRKGND